ncbi:MAG: cation:proton antiporter [Clostridiales bacterium]|nr:cation:proton antiporter [Clostridiales bacterium]
MLNKLYETLGGAGSVPVIIISIALMLIVGFLFTRITKLLRLPNVTAYILAGIVIGPFCLDLIPSAVIEGTDFISDIALAFIAFGVGEFFKFSTLKKNGGKVVVITLFEALTASVVVFILTFFILRLGFAFSLVLAALASATAPASTMMTIRQTKAKGDFVNTLLSVVALDDVVSLIAFSVAISVALASMDGNLSAGDILLPIAYNIVLVGVGIVFGFLLKLLMRKRSTDNRLIVSVALIFAICGIGAALNVSPLLGCMAMGTVYVNVSNDEKLFKQLNYFSPPILLLFFVRSGLSFRLDVLFDFGTGLGGIPLLVIGIAYFVVRIAGKYLGAFVGCLTVKKQPKVRNYLGMALVPQAGVSIGLAALGARLLGGDAGSMLQTVILSSSILYELIGPACAKLSLYLSGSYGPKSEQAEVGADDVSLPEPNEVETLEARLLQIQSEIEKKAYARSEEEEAFMDAVAAADAYPYETDEDTISGYMKRKFKNRR